MWEAKELGALVDAMEVFMLFLGWLVGLDSFDLAVIFNKP